MRLLDGQGRIFGRISLVDLGAVLLLLLLAIPTLRFGYRIVSPAPTISWVEPMQMIITPDQDAPLTIHGKRFSSKSVASMGGVSLITTSAQPRRLDLLIPTQRITPASYTLTVTNPRGLADVWKDPVRLESLPPEITKVHPREFSSIEKIRIVIDGKNFQKSSSVWIGDWSSNVRYVSPTRLEAWGTPPYPKDRFPRVAGPYTVRVTNYYGQSAELDNALTLLSHQPPPDPPPPPSPLSPDPPLPPSPLSFVPSKSTLTDPRDLIPVWVVCSFQEPEILGRRKWLKRGATTYFLDDHARPIAKIIRILDKTSIRKNDRSLILATLVLACNQDPSAQGVFLYGRGLRGCPTEGESVEIGKRLPFKFQRLDIEGTVLSTPVPLEGTWEEYVDR